MPDLAELSRRPPGAVTAAGFSAWFAAVADRLLNGVDFLVAGEPYRFAELEAYYHGPGHPDPFTHRDPLQYRNGRWYFHRTGGVYRGGSFKGVDLTLGDGTAMFGVLVRSMIAPNGTAVVGPSLVVDHLLARTGAATVAALDALIAERPWWDSSSPLAVRESDPPGSATVLPTARVGLSLKSSAGKPDGPGHVGRPYRYLTDPRRVTKGRPQTVLALHQQGKDAATIQALTGVPRAAIYRYVAAFAEGKRELDFARYDGIDLGPADVCRMLGTWAAWYGGAAGG